MSVPLTINGVTYLFPQQYDLNWGPVVTNWATAVTLGMLQTNGSNVMTGDLTLTGNGTITLQDSEGSPKFLTLAVPSPITSSYTLTLPGTAGSNGQVLSTNGSGVCSWINTSGTGTVNSGTTGQLAQYTGVGTTVGGATISGDATVASGGALTISSGAITNAKIATNASIALSKLAGTTAFYWYIANGFGVCTPLAVGTSAAVVTNYEGVPEASATTSTQIGYLSNVTSDVQAQIGTLLPLSGGTMSGSINMGSNTIVSLAQGTSTGQAIAFPVGTAQIASGAVSNWVNTTNSTSVSTSGYSVIQQATITTSGGNVLIMANGTAYSSGGGNFAGYVFVTRSGVSSTALQGGSAYVEAVSTAFIPVNITTIDQPPAGTYTYYFMYISSSNLGFSTSVGQSIIVIELKK